MAGKLPYEAASLTDLARLQEAGSPPRLSDEVRDVPPALAAAAARHERDVCDRVGEEAWPLADWPAVETRFLLCRDDRFFEADWMRALVRERLGIEPDEIDGGHCVMLSRPAELAHRLVELRAAAAARPVLL